MKRLFVFVALISLAIAAGARAGEEPKAGGGGFAAPGVARAVVANAWGAGKSAAQWHIESIDKIVNLTDLQKKAMTGIIEARDKAVQEFQAKNAEKVKQAGNVMVEAYKGKDKDAIAKSQKAYQELYAPMHEAMKKAQKDLDSVLTAEQTEKLQESRATAWIKASTDPVQLTEEQMKKAKDVYKEAMKAGGYEALGRGMSDKIQDILTPEQKAAIYKHRAMSYVKSMFSQAKLTSEQTKQVEAAVDAMGKEQNFKFDWAKVQQLNEKIEAVLTAEQKEAIKKARSAWTPIQPGAAAPGAGGARPNPAPKPAEKKQPGAKVMQFPGGGVQVIIGEGAEVRELRAKPATEKPPEKTPEGVKVDRLPGGGIQVIISEGAEAKRGEAQKEMLKALERARSTLQDTMKSAKARMGEKVKRQHELAELALQTYQKIEALGEDKKAESQELWRKLERIQGELRGTFGPAPAPMTPQPGFWGGPGAPMPGGSPGAMMPGAPMLGGRPGMPMPGGPMPGMPMPGGPMPGMPMPGAMAPGVPLAGGAAGAGNFFYWNREALERRLKELKEKAEQLAKAGKEDEAKRAKHEAHELQEQLQRLPGQPQWQVITPGRTINIAPGQPLNVPRMGPDPAIQELRNQMQELRRQIEELKSAVRKAGEKK
jgi:predicted transcriptional regulator